MLLVVKSSVVELACLTVEPVVLAPRTVPPEVPMMEVASVVAATLPTRLVSSWSWVRVAKLRVLVMEDCEVTFFEDEELVRLLSGPRL